MHATTGITGQQMTRLHELVHEAQDYVNRPFEPGETSRPITVYIMHLPEEAWQLGWTLVKTLHASHPDLFESFTERALHSAALDIVLAAETAPTAEEVAKVLQAQAAEEAAKWIIAVPLANTTLSRPWAPAGPSAAVRRAWDAAGHDRGAMLSDEDVRAEFEVFAHLGDRLSPPTRFMPPREEHPTDTRRFASLFLVEDGVVRQMAVDKARAKAHYAVATWALLAPPDDDHHLLPEVGVWWPQPQVRQPAEHRRFEGEWIPKERRYGAELFEYTPYELPEDESLLAAPFTAFEKIDRRSAQALLSSTSALNDAARGSRAQLGSRIRDVMAAIECLCEEKPRASNTHERWVRLATRTDSWKRLAEVRSYGPEDIDALQERLKNARNIGSHGADAALIDLGWTSGHREVQPGTLMFASDLMFTALHRDLEPLIFAVGHALEAVWKQMLETDFDDAVFAEQFT
jgi:hypothetical protein